MLLWISRGWLASLMLGFASAALGAATNSPWYSRAWQSDEGLPGNTVVGVAQTPDGFLWVATQNGLACFDGVRFKELAIGNPVSGLSTLNRKLLADRRGRLWLGQITVNVGGGGGGAVLCVEEGRVRAFTPEDGLPDEPVLEMAEDGDGAVWAASRGFVSCIGAGRVRSYSSEEGLPGGGVCHLASDGRGQLWFAQTNIAGVFRDGRFRALLTLNEPPGALRGVSSGGVWIAEGRRLLKYTGAGEPEDLGELAANRPEAKPTVLYEDRKGKLWCGTAKDGLFLRDGAGFDSVGILHHEILSLTEDFEGSLWAGTRGGGLNRLRPRAFELQELGSGPAPEAVVSVCQDTTGAIWAVTRGGMLAREDSKRWRFLSADDGWFARAASCVTAAPEGGVWVGTRESGLHLWCQGAVRNLTKRDGMASDFVQALLTAPNGDVWIGTVTSNALQRLRGGAFQTFLLPQRFGPFGTLALDATGRLWAATVGGLLLRVSDETLVDETTRTLGAAHPITSLCATPDGSLWIGYAGRGVGRLKRDRFTLFGKEQGFLDDYIIHIVADGRGRIWFAGNRGFSCVEEKEFEAVVAGRQSQVRSVVYGRDEGLPALQGSQGFWPGAWRSTDGRLWMPTLTGLIALDPRLLTENREPPPVVMERVVVDGRTVAAYESAPRTGLGSGSAPLALRQREARLRLPPGPRQVELEYTGLSFVAPRNVAFKYRLENWDRDWVEAGSRRVAYYGHMPPGDYRFQVLACNNDGIWNEAGVSLALTVLPHFWQTWWFIALALLMALGASGGTAHLLARRKMQRELDRLERARALERERTRIARDIHDELGTSLTRILMLSQPDDVDGTPTSAEMPRIHETARELTRAMDEVVWAVNPRQDTLEGLVSYVSLFAQEFLATASLSCRLDFPDRLPPLPLSAEVRHNVFLAVKEAIHNAARHAHAREIRLALRIGAHEFTLEITDDGIGFETGVAEPTLTNQPAPLKCQPLHHSSSILHNSHPRSGHGLRNMRERLSALGGRCEISSLPLRGTTVSLVVPLPAPGAV